MCDAVRMMSGQNKARKGERVDVRVDGDTLQLLDALVVHYCSNRSHVVRLAVAELARRHQLDAPKGAGAEADQRSAILRTNV